MTSRVSHGEVRDGRPSRLHILFIGHRLCVFELLRRFTDCVVSCLACFFAKILHNQIFTVNRHRVLSALQYAVR